MTAKEKTVLWAGVAILAMVTLYPPFIDGVPYRSSSDVFSIREVVHYRFLLTDSVRKLHFVRLFLEYLVVIIIMVTIIFSRRRTEHRLRRQVRKLTAERKKLHAEITDQNQSQEKLQAHRDQLEQRIQQQKLELAVTNEELQKQTVQKREIELRLNEKITELSAETEKLQHTIGLDNSAGEFEECNESANRVDPINPQMLKDLAELAKRLS